jgi:hypothetical protein
MTESTPSTESGEPASGAPAGNRRLWWVLVVLLGAIAIAVAAKLKPLLEPQAKVLAPLDPACDLVLGPCTSRFPGGGELRFAIEPRGIPVSTPLTLKVSARGLDADAVSVDFAGADMNMGFNRPALRPTGKTDGEWASFEGAGMIPVCVRQRMTWEARVLVQTPAGLLAAPFRFETSSSR